MHRLKVSQLSRLGVVLVVLFVLLSISASAQDPSLDGVGGTADVGPPATEELMWSTDLPALTTEQIEQLEYWLDRTDLPGPELAGAEVDVAGPEPGTESFGTTIRAAGSPQAPGSPRLFRNVNFSSKIPSNSKSNTMEASLGVGGKYAFFTGNWFAARSTNGGRTWAYVNAYSGFSDFCCDQRVDYDPARRMFMWLRMGSARTVSGNYENRFKLSISTNGAASFCTYTFTPRNVKSSWTNLWWDYPSMEHGADYLYLTWNLFNKSDKWKRSVVLRFPLDKLRSCSGFSYDYYYHDGWFTFTPVVGADHVMYWASNWPTSKPQNKRIRIWKWKESESWKKIRSTTRTVSSWSFTNKKKAKCGSSSTNWLNRSDQRLVAGARYEISGVLGKKVLGWWWNVKAGGKFKQPYIEAAAFYEDNLKQVSGSKGRPYVWNSKTCLAYPAAAPNSRGDVGLVLNYSTGSAKNPSIAFAIADDYVKAPPGWTYYSVRRSNARPSNKKWGDYNTVRTFQPGGHAWVAAAHYIPGRSNCSRCSSPVFFVFGRGRDYENWKYWRQR